LIAAGCITAGPDDPTGAEDQFLRFHLRDAVHRRRVPSDAESRERRGASDPGIGERIEARRSVERLVEHDRGLGDGEAAAIARREVRDVSAARSPEAPGMF
jgi:hypothetical protein